MRNDTPRYAPPLNDDAKEQLTEGVELSFVQELSQHVISGPYSAILSAIGLDGATGWPDVAAGNRYAIRLRRDRVLMVGDCEGKDGWDEAHGIAISTMSDGYAVLDLSGPRVGELMMRLGDIDPDLSSPVATRLLAGHTVIVYRYDADAASESSKSGATYRIHIDRARVEGFWRALEALAQAMRD